MGIAYVELKRYTEAIEAYREAIKIKPDYALAYYNLGFAYLDAGDKESAMLQYNILKSQDVELAAKLLQNIQTFKK